MGIRKVIERAGVLRLPQGGAGIRDAEAGDFRKDREDLVQAGLAPDALKNVRQVFRVNGLLVRTDKDDIGRAGIGKAADGFLLGVPDFPLIRGGEDGAAEEIVPAAAAQVIKPAVFALQDGGGFRKLVGGDEGNSGLPEGEAVFEPVFDGSGPLGKRRFRAGEAGEGPVFGRDGLIRSREEMTPDREQADDRQGNDHEQRGTLFHGQPPSGQNLK